LLNNLPDESVASVNPSESIREGYRGEYNNILSQVAIDLGARFSVIANPTLSKQETVTKLHTYICEEARTGKKKFFPWKSFFQFIPRLILMSFNLIYASLRFRVKTLPPDCIYFRTWLVPQSFHGGDIRDEYFRSLPDDLRSSDNVIVSFQPLDYSLLNKFRSFNKKDNYIIGVGFLNIFDIIKLIGEYVFTSYLKIKDDYIYDDFNISPLINHSLLEDYLKLRSFQAYQEKYICKKIRPFNLKAFVYVFENQSWEKVCCSFLKEESVKLVGYQSSGFSPVFLNFFPTVQDAEIQPMPDIILTVGELFTKYLLEHGNFRVPIKTYSALRFSYPSNGYNYSVLSPNENILKKILYAFPVQFSQYQDIINDLSEVFGDSSIMVDLKFHPCIKQSKIDMLSCIPDNFNIVTGVDVSLLSDNYDAVLFNDNSFGIESLLMGVRSYQYDRTNRFDDERFFYFDLWNTHLDYDGLLSLHDELRKYTYIKAYDVSSVSDYLNRMYRPYINNTEEFLKIINS